MGLVGTFSCALETVIQAGWSRRVRVSPRRADVGRQLGTDAVELAKSCDYALRGLLYLAQRGDPFEPILLRDIASGAEAPEAYLSKVFQSLRASNLVRSHRGRKRGYSLARPARNISLYDIILALEGPAALHSVPDGVELDASQDPVQWVWSRIENQFVSAVKQTTLRSIMDEAEEGKA
jgi:Rrf2 family protein